MRQWKLAPARGWRMLTGVTWSAGSLTADQIARVQHLVAIDAGLQSADVGKWMMTGNPSPLLCGASPVGLSDPDRNARLCGAGAAGRSLDEDVAMFSVTEAEAAAIRAAYEQDGELSAAIELRRLFPGVGAEAARQCARAIAGWNPPSVLQSPPSKRARPLPSIP